MKHRELTEKIIGCAYRKTFAKHLLLVNFGHCEEWNDEAILWIINMLWDCFASLAMTILVLCKALTEFTTEWVMVFWNLFIQAHEVQMVNYLVATGKSIGLIINFGERKARPHRLSSQPACHARHERAGGGQVEITCSAGACAAWT